MQREHLYQVFRVQWRTVLRLYQNVRFSGIVKRMLVGCKHSSAVFCASKMPDGKVRTVNRTFQIPMLFVRYAYPPQKVSASFHLACVKVDVWNIQWQSPRFQWASSCPGSSYMGLRSFPTSDLIYFSVYRMPSFNLKLKCGKNRWFSQNGEDSIFLFILSEKSEFLYLRFYPLVRLYYSSDIAICIFAKCIYFLLYLCGKVPLF